MGGSKEIMEKLSIIIPAFNEEYHLALLLESIKKQKGLSNFEIIVADADSDDKTKEIAKKFDARLIKGGKPAQGRNEGAKIARGELFLFLDADTAFKREDSLSKLIAEFQERKLDIATCCLEPFGNNKFLKFLYNLFYNWPILLLEKISGHGAGFILIKKELHQKIYGFDERIKLAEDQHYTKKAKKFGKFGILRKERILFSQRRFQEEGWVKTYLKYFLAELFLWFFGGIRSDIFKYPFGKHSAKNKILI